MKMIDLSVLIENNNPSDPKEMIPRIEYLDHETSVPSMLQFFGSATKDDLPNGLAWAIESLSLTSHSGTHLDAPYHYHPTMNKGQQAWTIDEIPLEWCYGDGVVLNFSDKKNGYSVTTADVKKELNRINYKLKPNDIVLIHTNAPNYWGKPEYLISGCGMGREVTLWLIDQGVHVMGTDAWSWDRPLPIIAEEFTKTQDKSIIWEGHFAGIEKGYCHIEKLTNLEKLPSTGFKISCFPIKIKGGSAGWIRAVAMLNS